jgi:hypothetical protein
VRVVSVCVVLCDSKKTEPYSPPPAPPLPVPVAEPPAPGHGLRATSRARRSTTRLPRAIASMLAATVASAATDSAPAAAGCRARPWPSRCRGRISYPTVASARPRAPSREPVSAPPPAKQSWSMAVSAGTTSLLTVNSCIKVRLDLQADKSPIEVKGPFFPRVVNPRYRMRGTNV